MNRESIPQLQVRTTWQKLIARVEATNSYRRILADYLLVAICIICYGSIAWLESSSQSVLFFGMLVIVISFHGISVQQAERTRRLLRDTLNELQQQRVLKGDLPNA